MTLGKIQDGARLFIITFTTPKQHASSDIISLRVINFDNFLRSHNNERVYNYVGCYPHSSTVDVKRRRRRDLRVINHHHDMQTDNLPA